MLIQAEVPIADVRDTSAIEAALGLDRPPQDVSAYYPGRLLVHVGRPCIEDVDVPWVGAVVSGWTGSLRTVGLRVWNSPQYKLADQSTSVVVSAVY